MINPAAARIRALAEQHGVSFVETTQDIWAGDLTSLSGDAVELDEIELLIVALERAGHVTGEEGTALHAEYLRFEHPADFVAQYSQS